MSKRTPLQKIADDLVRDLSRLSFGPPVTHVYNPLIYARVVYNRYLEKCGQGTREIVIIGMNPGPFGMAQVGVPFGEVNIVRDWLKVDGAVGKPNPEHPKRLITGFACPRSEVSGARLWGWARDRFGTPEKFFKRHFVANYCPLCFMGESGVNITPDKLRPIEREPLFAACDHAFRRLVEEMQPRYVVGVGKFAEGRARKALGGLNVEVKGVLHPSPASPLANRGWAEAMDAILQF